jgi:hypothetical protein
MPSGASVVLASVPTRDSGKRTKRREGEREKQGRGRAEGVKTREDQRRPRRPARGGEEQSARRGTERRERSREAGKKKKKRDEGSRAAQPRLRPMEVSTAVLGLGQWWWTTSASS